MEPIDATRAASIVAAINIRTTLEEAMKRGIVADDAEREFFLRLEEQMAGAREAGVVIDVQEAWD